MEENNKSKYTSLEPNIAAALSYIVGPLTGIAFWIIEKEDKFVRFHAMQSILFGAAIFIANIIAGALVAVIIGAILLPLVSIAGFIFWLLLMWKAYNNESYELPVIGKIAKAQTEK